MAKKKPKRGATPKTKSQREPGRSPKAGRPLREARVGQQTRRRRRSATVAVKKDTTVMQTDAGTKVLWGANQRRPTRV